MNNNFVPQFFPNPANNFTPPMPINSLYKTSLCKHFQQQKYCHVGNKCHFAHGEHELRKRDEPLPLELTMKMMNIPYNNYKT